MHLHMYSRILNDKSNNLLPFRVFRMLEAYRKFGIELSSVEEHDFLSEIPNNFLPEFSFSSSEF